MTKQKSCDICQKYLYSLYLWWIRKGGTGCQSDENELLKMIIETQASRIKEQEQTIKELREMVDELRSLKANLEETLEEFRRQFFGIKSEKTSSKSKDKSQADKRTVKVKEHTRERKPKSTRKDLYAELPVREIVCPVEESERFCDWCGVEMLPVTSKYVREELRITPASASAVAYVIFNRCFMGLPFYRMEAAFKQLGARIPRETLANWCILSVKKYLLPVYERLHEELLKRKKLCRRKKEFLISYLCLWSNRIECHIQSRRDC